MTRSLPDGRVKQASERFSLLLHKTKGEKIGLPNTLICRYSYEINIDTYMTEARLESIDGVEGSPLPITLNAAGIEGTLSFIGACPDTPVKFEHYSLICYNVWLVINLHTGVHSGSILGGKDRDIIYQTVGNEDENIQEILRKQED